MASPPTYEQVPASAGGRSNDPEIHRPIHTELDMVKRSTWR